MMRRKKQQSSRAKVKVCKTSDEIGLEYNCFTKMSTQIAAGNYFISVESGMEFIIAFTGWYYEHVSFELNLTMYSSVVKAKYSIEFLI
jgi:hypothetical protein